MNYARRQQRVCALIKKENLDGLLITTEENVRYLSGFTGEDSSILLTRDGGRFFTDGRYRDQASQEVVGLPISAAVGKSLPQQLVPFIPSERTFTLGFEANNITVLQHGMLMKALGENVDLEPLHNGVERFRIRKDADEVSLIGHAAKITIGVFDELLSHFKPGITERQVQRLIRNLMYDAGADEEAFETIVLFGKRTALPHGRPEDVVLRKNDLILLDFGAKYNGYCSDFTRTFTFGKPSKTVTEAYNHVRKALEYAQLRAKPGVECSELQNAVKKRFRKVGHDRKYLHGLGHGVGLEVHEGPHLSVRSNDILEQGMVITIEPGLYSGQWGGIRLENLLAVTKNGVDNLTPAPMQLRY